MAPLDFRGMRLGECVRTIAAEIGFEAERLYQASQVHGARTVVAEGDTASLLKEEADALVAFEARRAVGVRIADCTPVLVADPASGAVAAIHAGWRGVVANVIASGVGAINGANLIAAIGPCIEACCFEVGEDVAEKIAEASDADVIVRGHAKPHVDMRRATRIQLRTAGIADDRIFDVEGCTKHDPRFHSHRRDADRAGRNIAIIVAR
jgi:YfiH family protein